MKLGRPKPATIRTDEQREQLEQWTGRRSTAQALARRAAIVLLSIEGMNDIEIAKRLRTTRETVGRWRRRFLKLGVDACWTSLVQALQEKSAIKMSKGSSR